MSVAEFIRIMEEKDVPEEVSRSVYDYLSEMWSNRKDRSVHPYDSLYGSYRIAEEDLEDAVVELSKQCGGVEPTTELVGHLPLITVTDMVRMILFLRAPESPDFYES